MSSDPKEESIQDKEDEVWKAVCDNPGHTSWELRNILKRNVGIFLRRLLRSRKIYKIRWQKWGIRYYPNWDNAETINYIVGKRE